MGARFLVLGGAGDMGSSVVYDLYSSNVDEIIIGDINEEGSKSLIEKLRNSISSNSKISFKKLNIEDEDEFIKVAKDVDIIINTIGPFYKYGKNIIKTSIEIEKDYVDINDDYDATLEILKLEEQIKNSNTRALIGMGWTPGITNVCAKAGYDFLDETYDINISWVGSAADAKGLAVILHTFHAVTGEVPMYLNGELCYVPALQSKLLVDFPEPIGKAETYYVGHPEPITIPRYLKNIKNVTLRGGLIPDWQNSLLRQFVLVGLTEDREINIRGIKISAREFLANFVHQTFEQFKMGGVEASGFWVEIKGKKNDKDAIIQYSGADRMNKLTGWSASIGAQFLFMNKNKAKPGLYAPEALIDPDWFMQELKRRGLKLRKEIRIIEY